MNDCREEEINTPLVADGSQAIFDCPPSPFSINEAWILTQARWFWGDTSLSSWFAGFSNKVSIPCPSNLSFPLLVRHAGKQCKVGLSNKNIEVGEAVWCRNALEAGFPPDETCTALSNICFPYLLPMTKNEAHLPPDCPDMVMLDSLKLKFHFPSSGLLPGLLWRPPSGVETALIHSNCPH